MADLQRGVAAAATRRPARSTRHVRTVKKNLHDIELEGHHLIARRCRWR